MTRVTKGTFVYNGTLYEMDIDGEITPDSAIAARSLDDMMRPVIVPTEPSTFTKRRMRRSHPRG